MIKKIKTLQKILSEVSAFGNQGKRLRAIQEDALAFQMLQNLVPTIQYIPFTAWSLRPFNLITILNDVVINNRTSIIEFGSGISTILIAKLIKHNQLNTKFFSVDSDAEWINKVLVNLRKEELHEYAQFIHAPLTSCSKALDGLPWYSEEELDKKLKNQPYFDLVIIDGPPANVDFERYPALPYLYDKIHRNFSIYLDDSDRKAEEKIMKMWEESFHLRFQLIGDRLGRATQGMFYDNIPF